MTLLDGWVNFFNAKEHFNPNKGGLFENSFFCFLEGKESIPTARPFPTPFMFQEELI